jgi:hypothetical protein
MTETGIQFSRIIEQPSCEFVVNKEGDLCCFSECRGGISLYIPSRLLGAPYRPIVELRQLFEFA